MNRHTHGFTLVEIALAMLVFSLGILAFFALLSAGLDQGAVAHDHTRCATFADSVLGGLRGISDELCETATNSEWSAFWTSLQNGTTNVSVAAGGADGVWAGPIVIRGGATYTNAYTNFALHLGEPGQIVNHVIHYLLDIELTNSLSSAPWPNRAEVTLKTWEGAFGTAHDQDALIFYTEYADRGGL